MVAGAPEFGRRSWRARRVLACAAAGLVVMTAPVAAQPSAPPTATPASPPSAVAATASPERDPLLPKVDIFFPEGDFDLTLSRLIKNAFVEGQFKYNFVKGDITAFLRYRYYGFSKTYQLSVFDAVEFDALEKFSNDFSRVRGGLFLMQMPRDYHQRAFLLAELDRTTSSKDDQRFSTNRSNIFLRLGYQLGTPEDERSNAIVGESRARIQRLFSAYRSIGPGGAGLTGALTWAAPLGDFDYLQAEFEALKRFDIGRSVLVQRLHGGSFLRKVVVREAEAAEDRYSIPRSELFRLDGRENLKGLQERRRGTEELHTTAELFYPWFVDRERRALGVAWQSWYWVLYAGYGTAGFEREVLTDFDSYVSDAGLGFESSFRLKRYSFFLSAIVAQALGAEGGGLKAKVSIKSFH